MDFSILMNPLFINIITISLLIFIMFWFGNKISRTIGFTNLNYYYKAFTGRAKGVILIRIYNEDGTVNYNVGTKKSGRLILSKINGEEKESAFILDSQCVYKNEMGLSCVDYNESDIDPREWKSGLSVTTSPMALQNIVTNATKSEILSNGVEDFILKNFKIIGIGLLILIGILGFLILTQNGDITSCYEQLSKINIVAQ